jgi:uncharacterized protein (DUF2147 family)
MKKILIAAILFSSKGYSQNSDAIVGKWIKANKEDLIIEVYKQGNEYEGKVKWSKDKTKPEGFLLMDDLKYNQKAKKWEGGKIHDPKGDRTYKASVVMNANGTLEVSGSMLFIKSKRVFKRVK